MTDAVANSSPPEARAVLQRRLTGLAVLMLAVFLLSLLLRVGSKSSDTLPAVVIRLDGAVQTLPAEQPAAVLGQESARTPARPAVPTPEPSVSAPLPPPPDAAAVSASKNPAVVVPPPRMDQPAASGVKPAPEKTAPQSAAGSIRWYVNVGAYKDPAAARAIANRVRLAGFRVQLAPISAAAGPRLNRVRAGPFRSREEAESARVALIVEGLTKATTTSEK